MTIDVLSNEQNASLTKRNAPKKVSERFENTERSKTEKNAPVIEEKPEPEIPDEEGLTPKQRIFVMEYLRDFDGGAILLLVRRLETKRLLRGISLLLGTMMM